jgi:hypothetical protein
MGNWNIKHFKGLGKNICEDFLGLQLVKLFGFQHIYSDFTIGEIASCAKKCKRHLPANLLDFLDFIRAIVRHIQLASSR